MIVLFNYQNLLPLYCPRDQLHLHQCISRPVEPAIIARSFGNLTVQVIVFHLYSNFFVSPSSHTKQQYANTIVIMMGKKRFIDIAINTLET